MARPLPSRADVLSHFEGQRGPLTLREIATAFKVAEASERGLLRLLDDLVLTGQLEADDQERFCRPGTHRDTAPTGVEHRGAGRVAEGRDTAPRGKPEGRDRSAHVASKPGKHGAASPRDAAGSKKALPSRKERRAQARAASRSEAAPDSEPFVLPGSGKAAGSARAGAPSGAAAVPVASGASPEGTLSIAARGFGFVSGAGPNGEDVFVPKESIMGGLHGDRVKVDSIRRSARGFEGVVAAIVERRIRRVPGTLRRRGKSAWVEPDDARMRSPIPLVSDVDTRGPEGNSGSDGDAVVISITRYPELPDELPEGKLEAVLGRPGELSVEVQKILVREQIEEVHSEKAFREAESYGETVPEPMLEGREDLTQFPLPTIDPEDARDHDDAVWVEKTPRGTFRALIAIADVSSYVVPGTKLDEEALARSFSLYLPDRAIPMLPRPLSSNLCSLLPDVLRLCLAVDCEVDATGNVTKSRVVRGFMKSQAKLSYGSVARALGLTEAPPVDPKAEALKPGLAIALELSKILRERRMKRGALDLDLPEAKLTLDSAGKPTAIGRRAQDAGVKQAYQLIEELMLLANEVVARFFSERNMPTVYRVHAPPDGEKLDRFAAICEMLAVPFDAEDAQDPKRLSELLRTLEEHPQANVLRMMLLRSLKQATYDVVNIGHFGLASKAYLHFTSPIRRYPDLLVHRAMHAFLLGNRRAPNEGDALAEAARHASETERRGMEIEREIVDVYRCVFMQDHVGERYEGSITAFVGSGAYVQLDDPFVDVMLRFEDTGERYEVDDSGLFATAERGRGVMRLGERVVVEITSSVIARRTVYGRRIGASTEASPRLGAGHDKRGRRDRGRDKKAHTRDGRAASTKAGKGRESLPPRQKKADRKKRGK